MIYGERGVLTEIGGKLQCHFCGRTYDRLCGHVIITHEMSVEAYKTECGLNQTTGLISQRVADVLRVKNVHLTDPGVHGPAGAKGRAVVLAQRPPSRTKSLQGRRAQAASLAVRALHPRPPAPLVQRQCRHCGGVFMSTRNTGYCSSRCIDARRQRSGRADATCVGCGQTFQSTLRQIRRGSPCCSPTCVGVMMQRARRNLRDQLPAETEIKTDAPRL